VQRRFWKAEAKEMGFQAAEKADSCGLLTKGIPRGQTGCGKRLNSWGIDEKHPSVAKANMDSM
jgi:hypothetical protein